jgi:hypothetical protein
MYMEAQAREPQMGLTFERAWTFFNGVKGAIYAPFTPRDVSI